MARRRRIWESLSESTRKRYLAKGRKLGQSPEEVKAYYEAGNKMGAYRGHQPTAGVSERKWSELRRAAKAAKLHEDGDVSVILSSLLAKGFTHNWILEHLSQKEESRDTYRSRVSRLLRAAGKDTGWQPGRRRYHRRNLLADIELFYYH